MNPAPAPGTEKQDQIPLEIDQDKLREQQFDDAIRSICQTYGVDPDHVAQVWDSWKDIKSFEPSDPLIRAVKDAYSKMPSPEVKAPLLNATENLDSVLLQAPPLPTKEFYLSFVGANFLEVLDIDDATHMLDDLRERLRRFIQAKVDEEVVELNKRQAHLEKLQQINFRLNQ